MPPARTQRRSPEFVALVQRLKDWRWRLNNLYWITDKDGQRVKFELNWAQAELFNGMHYMNVILKARQLGFTTFIQIFMLDAAIFNPNIRAGTIAHTLDDAKAIFKDKVKYPYDNLPAQIRAMVSVEKDNATELEFSNNSSIRVGTSLRSGTLQYLHISEYGKMCAKFPEKAREVRTGSLNTVQAGQIVFVESTAEGQEGHFYDVCENAKTKARMGTKLTPLDFKFHFFPWWREPQYSIDPDGVVIPEAFVRYFDKLATFGVRLTPGQEAWYVKKAETQLEDMKREYPSTAEEAFEASVEGAYYGHQMARAEMDQRIGVFPWNPKYPVHTAWDIGIGDETTIWFFQILPTRVRLIAYYENSGEGMPHYIGELRRRQVESRREFEGEIVGETIVVQWQYGSHFMPHDIRVREWSNGLQRIEQMAAATLKDDLGKPRKVPDHYVDDGINACRTVLGICEFDEAECATGLKALRSYRKDWDEDRGVWKDKPRHDWASHGADGFRSMAMVYKELPPEPVRERPRALQVAPQPGGAYDQVTLDDMWGPASRAQRRI